MLSIAFSTKHHMPPSSIMVICHSKLYKLLIRNVEIKVPKVRVESKRQRNML
ncbi:MAG: hypothetical protein ACTS73_02340 [Arsenophonus sp. NEOnobi-MAG3]